MSVESGVSVTFNCCPPGLVRYYRLLGYRTYPARLVSTAEGMMVPLVAILSDAGHFQLAGSLLAPFVDGFFGEGKRPTLDVARWAHLFDADSAPVRFDSMAVWDRVSRLRGLSGIQPTMLSALSEDTVRKLSEKGFVMRLSAGQLLTEKGIAQQEMFVILDGAFEAYDGDRRLRVMGSGDVIGEVAFFGSSARRSASVRAASDGQVLVLRRRFMDELITSDPACGAEILFQLARVLADRVDRHGEATD